MASFNLAARFRHHAVRTPTRPALAVRGVTYSYGDLAIRAGRVAAWLRRETLAPSPRVGILASRSLDAYAGILGASWAGCTYVPLSPKHPEARLLQLIAAADLHALIIDEAGLEHLTDRVLVACPSHVLSPTGPTRSRNGVHVDGEDVLETLRPLDAPLPLPADAVASLVFTSGSTGTPKGVLVTTGNIAHFLRVMQERYRIDAGDRLSQVSEITFDLSTFDIFMALHHGASVHVVPESQLPAPARFIREHAVTVWLSVPSIAMILREIKALKPGAFPSLRLSLFCGEPLSTALAEAWRVAAPNSIVENLYGPTEATVSCLLERVSTPPRVTTTRGIIAIGTPNPGMHAAVLDASCNPVPRGESGELAVSGPQVTAGYHGDPEQTAQRYRRLQHPTLGESVWYLTGDLSYEDASGTFHYLGRIDNQVKVLGNRVELEDVEAHLRDVCACDAVAAVAWPVEHGSARGIVAFVSGCEMEAGGIREALRGRLPAYMVPAAIHRLDALPRTDNGKIDRAALTRRLDDRLER